jgi:hypothetical protein
MNFIPVGAENCTAASLVALNHCPSGGFVSSSVDLFEKVVKSAIAFRFFLLELLLASSVNVVPILLVFRT